MRVLLHSDDRVGFCSGSYAIAIQTNDKWRVQVPTLSSTEQSSRPRLRMVGLAMFDSLVRRLRIPPPMLSQSQSEQAQRIAALDFRSGLRRQLESGQEIELRYFLAQL